MGLRNLRGSLRKAFTEQDIRKDYPKFIMASSGKIIKIPDGPIKQTDVTYPLIEPYAYAHIKYDYNENLLVYEIKEPELNEDEGKAFKEILRGLVELVDVELTKVKSQETAMEYLENKVHDIMHEAGMIIPKLSYNKIMYFIYRNFVGLNEIEPLMEDPYIEDIGCVGYNVPVYIIHKKFGSIPTNIVYSNESELNQFIIKMAERAGRYISYAEPLLDGALPDGSRVQASLAQDVTTKGPTFSIRKFSEEPISPVELMRLRTANSEVMAFLWFVMEHGVSMLICGGTATGKTTMLNAISMFIPPEDKIVSIEDTRELSLPHKNWIPAVARIGFGAPEGGEQPYGSVDMYELLRASFRQNPDYVIVGEIRGKEAYVMFQGMASGHASLGTMHAAGVETVIKRLSSPPIELSPTLIEILDLVLTMVHAQEKGKSSRRIKNITEIQSVAQDGTARYATVFRWIPSKDSYEPGEGRYILAKIAESIGMDISKVQAELDTRKIILEKMLDKGITEWKEVSNTIEQYKKSPSRLLKQLSLS